ncbi:MAG: Blue-light absorbing proteorhodopsin [Alphaproteobacteria bacterium MarineAlpha5_Bin11]|nr:biphenyl 2,3-dioxygenase [Pelagibacteraceae bacterium]PPR42258.1 MAG: Blue-light absorbing proteorhodopsin [Alphaproteobacteria bacterium MarineAlpha5_Bin11]|tara:strand:- start:54 stop:761 length:708 start_codon:yes stop_codon:yes gene_type:complete
MEYFLQSSDYVAVSFWLVSIAMVASTTFFFYEGMFVKASWRTSMVVAGLVTLIAAIHYYYMREFWVHTGESPTVYRYIDWLLTVPLQMIEFYLILVAAGLAVSSSVFWRLLLGTMVMLLGGYSGEAGWVTPSLGFVIGMTGWVIIVFEIFRGEANVAASKNKSLKQAFDALRMIVLIGWAIYPIGYIFGFLTPMIGGSIIYEDALNIIYNLADFINKILFGLIIWNAAIKDTIRK